MKTKQQSHHAALAGLLVSDAAYSISNLVQFGLEQGIISKDDAYRQKLLLTRLIRRTQVETTVPEHGVSVDAWFGSTWSALLSNHMVFQQDEMLQRQAQSDWDLETLLSQKEGVFLFKDIRSLLKIDSPLLKKKIGPALA